MQCPFSGGTGVLTTEVSLVFRAAAEPCSGNQSAPEGLDSDRSSQSTWGPVTLSLLPLRPAECQLPRVESEFRGKKSFPQDLHITKIKCISLRENTL